MQFLSDIINLTQGQLLVKYWWLWLSIILVFMVYTRLFISIYEISTKILKNAYREYKRNSNAK